MILVSSLVRMTLAVGLVGVVGYDAISLTTTHLQVEDHAQQAARVGYDALRHDRGVRTAYGEVVRYAQSVGETVVPGSFVVARDRSVSVTLTREAKTIAAAHLPKISSYVVVTATGSAGDPLEGR